MSTLPQPPPRHRTPPLPTVPSWQRRCLSSSPVNAIIPPAICLSTEATHYSLFSLVDPKGPVALPTPRAGFAAAPECPLVSIAARCLPIDYLQRLPTARTGQRLARPPLLKGRAVLGVVFPPTGTAERRAAGGGAVAGVLTALAEVKRGQRGVVAAVVGHPQLQRAGQEGPTSQKSEGGCGRTISLLQ